MNRIGNLHLENPLILKILIQTMPPEQCAAGSILLAA